MQTQFQLGRYIHACTNGTHSRNLQDVIPTLAGIIRSRIKSCRFARECVSFVAIFMDVPTQLELCLHDQLDIASLLPVSLLFIVIPTSF